MNPHLFVYGTLLAAAGHPKGERLRREARLLGAASIPGNLYSLGGYPGLVEAADALGRVHGEVYALDSPATSLEWLDAYEGIVAGAYSQNDYERVERPVHLATGAAVTAWVYLYRKDTRRLQAIPDGRWLGGQT
jgi:gamma-glutamylcyclotransferase (GGCT)/AIG2-like uncharacterized protein YtfP